MLGVVGAWLTGRAMQAVLFHVPSFNVPTLAGAATVMALVSIGACLAPSHRAVRVSPMEALGDH
jgi:ABC-type lipoprotein release transport system permease subunit